MQSIFRLPSWCNDQLGPKMSDDTILDKMRPVPVDIPIFNKIKRKFSDAVTPFPPSPNKKSRSEVDNRRDSARLDLPAKPDAKIADSTNAAHVNNLLPPTLSSTSDSTFLKSKEQKASSSISSTAANMDTFHDPLYLPSDLTPLQQSIETQFNMQILMKHNELRLIEQELAKCQIALEQLRRCELRPYPGYDRPTLAVSEGTGSAILPAPGSTRPAHPAPHGVTDGPYSRHYQQWLLHDDMFDSVPLNAFAHGETPGSAASRSSRAVAPARKTVSKTCSMSTRHTEAAQSLPNYPAAPARDKSAPLVLRRSTDNQLVKLICNNCHRGNFSSIQGFLNHCRIAHKVDYKSHDAAAIDCGQTLDENELANLPPQTPAPAAAAHHPKPAVHRPSPAVATPIRTNLVHPLNSTTASNLATVKSAAIRRANAQPIKDLHVNRPSEPQASDAPLKPASALPRLSKLFAKHNFCGDLETAAALARQRIDLSTIHDDLPSPDYSEQNSPLAFTAGPRPFITTTAKPHDQSHNTSANEHATRPVSRKAHRLPSAAAAAAPVRPRPAPLAPAPPAMHHHDAMALDTPYSVAPSSATFSPGTTAESAPGLVSDHEDDENDASSASDGEGGSKTPTSEIALHGHHHGHHGHHHVGHGHHRQRSCVENGAELDIVVEDGEGVGVGVEGVRGAGVLIRRNSVFGGSGRKNGGK